MHSICIAKQNNYDIPSTLHFDFGEFGWENRVLYSTEAKANYLYTALLYFIDLGVSLVNSNDEKLYEYLKEFPNAVLHTIDGLLSSEDIYNLSDKNIKLLILGYKVLGRGDEYYHKHRTEIEHNINWLKDNIIFLRDKFEVISFDNLAIEHMDLKNKVSRDVWNYSYMGDEGSYTFYIDAVNKQYALSSLSLERYNLKDTVDEMFMDIRTKENHYE